MDNEEEDLPPDTRNDVATMVLHDDGPHTGAVFPPNYYVSDERTLGFAGSVGELDDLFCMYINNPGDDDIIDEEEGTASLWAMADFLHNVVD